MVKVLHVVPHLSTGGLPNFIYQILLKTNQYSNSCLEYKYLSKNHITHRKKIINILGDQFYSEKGLGSFNLKDYNIIFIHEEPESFISDDDCSLIYDKKRTYKIIQSSHTNDTDLNNKKYHPDYYALVSELQIEKYKHFNIPTSLLETDIEYKEKDTISSQDFLKFDPEKYHILNVGILTENKNQEECLRLFDALDNPNLCLHMVGPMAANFEHYWGDFVAKYKNSSNVFFHGESDFVYIYYQAANMFLFTSKGEVNPLVIKEALGYNLPIFMYPLDQYMGKYDKYDNIHYLTHDEEKNIQLLKQFISNANFTSINE